MSDIYRVLSAKINFYEKDTENEHFIIFLQLDTNITVTRAAYVAKTRFGRQRIHSAFDSGYNDDKLHQMLRKNQYSVDFIVNRYIVADIKQTDTGMNLGHVASWDLVDDFEQQLQLHISKQYDDFNKYVFFIAHLPIYKFLVRKNYPQFDGLIRLRGEYKNLVVDEQNMCFSYEGIDEKNLNSNKFLTRDNIQKIFQKFYKNKHDSDPDIFDSYICYKRHIVYSYSKADRHTTRIQSRGSHVVLKIGDSLSSEQANYLKVQSENG